MQTLSELFDQIWERKNTFLLVFFAIFMLSYGILVAIDFIPEKPAVTETPKVIEDVAAAEVVETKAPERQTAQYPVRVVIEKLGTDVQVLNPAGSSIAELDEALLEGVVRHPGSADFKNTGTMFLFGHSSYLPVVRNKNFQAFNGLQKLSWGDEVSVFSDDAEYVYRVTKVTKVAASETSVSLEKGKEGLILVTCNSFGSKDDRFMVEAELIEKKAL